MKAFIRVMKAASDPTRVKILKILEKRTMCVCELQTALGAAQSTTSKHLKILEDAGLVGFPQGRALGQLHTGRWSPESLCGVSAWQSSPLAQRPAGNIRARRTDGTHRPVRDPEQELIFLSLYMNSIAIYKTNGSRY
jgi:hypothetical protein